MIKIPLKSCHLKPFYNFIRHQSSNYNRAYFELFNKSQTDSGDTHTLKEFSHVKSDGTVNMVGTISKPITSRVAEASCSVNLGKYAYQQFKCNVNKKGDVASVAKIGKTWRTLWIAPCLRNILCIGFSAGIMAAKKTSDLIPLCHSLNLNKVDIDIENCDSSFSLTIKCRAETMGQTGQDCFI